MAKANGKKRDSKAATPEGEGGLSRLPPHTTEAYVAQQPTIVQPPHESLDASADSPSASSAGAEGRELASVRTEEQKSNRGRWVASHLPAARLGRKVSATSSDEMSELVVELKGKEKDKQEEEQDPFVVEGHPPGMQRLRLDIYAAWFIGISLGGVMVFAGFVAAYTVAARYFAFITGLTTVMLELLILLALCRGKVKGFRFHMLFFMAQWFVLLAICTVVFAWTQHMWITIILFFHGFAAWLHHHAETSLISLTTSQRYVEYMKMRKEKKLKEEQKKKNTEIGRKGGYIRGRKQRELELEADDLEEV